jgi:site-specific DNA recombinase
VRRKQQQAIEAVGVVRLVRCAIYTRKSTEEGLEQKFNSLDAQRESAEAYISSQRQQGWQMLPTRYDDGGYSGGNMDRPALQRLLADVEAGHIDCIVVYKVDRLSRSLLDFARIIAILDERSVSFVSITQQFNTTSSLGRLTLNILLSFAQFERELISERTRDKMAAARRRGQWVGGRPALGYDVAPEGGRLIVNESEAAQVREIFGLYLEHRSLWPVMEELNQRQRTTKQWTSQRGRAHGGCPFTTSAVSNILKNVTYAGKVGYQGEVYAGEHAAIVDTGIWEQVQQSLRSGATERVGRDDGALLRGLLYCEHCLVRMFSSHGVKAGRRYRYYVCANRKDHPRPIARLSGGNEPWATRRASHRGGSERAGATGRADPQGRGACGLRPSGCEN